MHTYADSLSFPTYLHKYITRSLEDINITSIVLPME